MQNCILSDVNSGPQSATTVLGAPKAGIQTVSKNRTTSADVFLSISTADWYPDAASMPCMIQKVFWWPSFTATKSMCIWSPNCLGFGRDAVMWLFGRCVSWHVSHLISLAALITSGEAPANIKALASLKGERCPVLTCSQNVVVELLVVELELVHQLREAACRPPRRSPPQGMALEEVPQHPPCLPQSRPSPQRHPGRSYSRLPQTASPMLWPWWGKTQGYSDLPPPSPSCLQSQVHDHEIHHRSFCWKHWLPPQMMSTAKSSCDVTHLEGHASWNGTDPTEPVVLQEEPSAPEVLGTPSKL